MSNAYSKPHDVVTFISHGEKCIKPPVKEWVGQFVPLTHCAPYAPSWQAIAIARASKPLGVRPAIGRLIKGTLRDRMSQAPSTGEGRGGVRDAIEAAAAAAATAALRLEAETDDLVDDLLSADESDGRLERDLSL
jgi:hypothetical protein